MPGPPAVIVDVDGTLCDVSGIRHLVMGEHKKRKDLPPFPRGVRALPAQPDGDRLRCAQVRLLPISCAFLSTGDGLFRSQPLVR